MIFNDSLHRLFIGETQDDKHIKRMALIVVVLVNFLICLCLLVGVGIGIAFTHSLSLDIANIRKDNNTFKASIMKKFDATGNYVE